MALTLPGWLVEAIRYIGYEFPQTNEDVMHQWADSLRQLASTVDSAEGELQGAVRHLTSNNEGPTMDQILDRLSANDSNLHFLKEFSEGATQAATTVDLMADAVVVMKGVVLFQLALLAPAIASGPVSFLLKKGVEYAIDQAVDYAVSYFLAGE